MQLFSSNNLFCLYLMYPNYTNFLTALSYTACPRPRGGWNIGLPNVSGAGLLMYCCRCNSATADLTPIDNSGVMVGRSPSNAETACLLWLIWFACGGGYLLLLLFFFFNGSCFEVFFVLFSNVAVKCCFFFFSNSYDLIVLPYLFVINNNYFSMCFFYAPIIILFSNFNSCTLLNSYCL